LSRRSGCPSSCARRAEHGRPLNPCKRGSGAEEPSLEAYVNVRKWGRQVLLAVCDAEILGKTFQEKDLSFEVKEEFYKGVKTSVDEALSLVRQSTIVNLVGANVVQKAIEKGYVHPEAVITICGVQHAQIVKM